MPALSSLFPALNVATAESDTAMRSSKDNLLDENTANATTIPFSELSAWINVHMSMNDTLYPVSVSPSYGAIPCSPLSSRDLPHISTMSASEVDAMKDSISNMSMKTGQQPSRTVGTIPSLSRSKPTIINGCSTTVVHVIGSSLQAKNSFRKYGKSFDKADGGSNNSNSSHSNSGHDLLRPSSSPSLLKGIDRDNSRGEHLVLSDSESERTSPQGPGGRPRNYSTQSDGSQEEMLMHHGSSGAGDDFYARGGVDDIELLFRNNTAYLTRPELMLPPLYLNFCSKAKLYLISPYHSASISGCVDCEIVIGAVFGAVIVSNCERVRITCACRKLLILNCFDCAFNVASLTTTIIAGDSRGIVVGKRLKHHWTVILFVTLNCIVLLCIELDVIAN